MRLTEWRMNERHKEGHNGVYWSKLKLATSGISSTTSYLVVPILCKKDAPESPCALGRGWTFLSHASLRMGSPGAWQTWSGNHVATQSCGHPIMWLTFNPPPIQCHPFHGPLHPMLRFVGIAVGKDTLEPRDTWAG